MLYKSKGIILHKIKFGETSIIAKIYTETHGLISCLVHGVRKNKSQNKSAVFQLMNQVDFVFYSKSRDQLATLKEIKLIKPYQSLHSDIRKSTTAMFLAEIIIKAMKEEEINPSFYLYLEDALWKFDNSEQNLANFHIFFLYKMTSFLGIQPQNNWTVSNSFFDFENGRYTSFHPPHSNFFNEEISKIFFEISILLESNLPTIELNKTSRKQILLGLLDYYRLHLSGFGEVKSIEVLEEVFN